jgi:hypothetical protein
MDQPSLCVLWPAGAKIATAGIIEFQSCFAFLADFAGEKVFLDLIAAPPYCDLGVRNASSPFFILEIPRAGPKFARFARPHRLEV